MAPVVTRALVASLALLVAGAAQAQMPPPPAANAGRVDLGGGWMGTGLGGPTVRGRFSWYATRHWTLGIELGYTTRPVTVGADTATLTFLDAGFTGTFSPVRLGPVLPYALVAGGMRLVGDRDGGHYYEGSTRTLDLGLGAWMRLSHRLGIFLEDRFDVSNLSVSVGGHAHGMRLGGNMACLGVVVLFDPEPFPS